MALEDFEAVLTGIQMPGKKVAPAFRAMTAFLRWCGRRGYPMDARFAFGLEAPYAAQRQVLAVAAGRVT